jgi:hypothetical protein
MSSIVVISLILALNIVSLVLLINEYLIFIAFAKLLITILLIISYSINFVLFNIKKVHKTLNVNLDKTNYHRYGFYYATISIVIFILTLIIIQSNKMIL